MQARRSAGLSLTLAEGCSDALGRDLSAGEAATLSVGSNPDSGWRVIGPAIADQHLHLYWDGATLRVSARARTLLGTQSVGRDWAVVAPGDVLRFGTASIWVLERGASPRPPPRSSERVAKQAPPTESGTRGSREADDIESLWDDTTWVRNPASLYSEALAQVEGANARSKPKSKRPPKPRAKRPSTPVAKPDGGSSSRLLWAAFGATALAVVAALLWLTLS